MGIVEEISDRLGTLPEASAVALQIGADNYFDVIRAVLDNFASTKNIDCIYVSSSIPSETIANALNVLDIKLTHVYFVDCISHMMTGITRRTEKTFFVESPSMLETIMLKVEYLLKKTRTGSKIVFLDSINSLAIHNDSHILSEFLHILVNNLRSKQAYTIILAIEEHSSPEVSNMMNLVCDETIIVERTK